MNSIPLLNISHFDSDREAFIAEFGSAYKEWGFAGITGHGIDHDVIKAALLAAEKFFALPNAKKQTYQSEFGFKRGYVPFGLEKAKGAKHSDLKEFYHIGRYIPEPEQPSSLENLSPVASPSPLAHLSPNVWPLEVGEFKAAFETIYAALDALALRLLEVAALYLGLPIDYFNDGVRKGEALLRVLHYPPLMDEDIPNLRAAEHEDINLITLLVGSEQDGLEVLSRTGDWVPISMIEGTIICNVGDMLQRLTNNKLPSTTHRVVNPVGDKARMSRYSIPFFVHPHPEVPLDCLPQCVDAEHPAQYPAIKSGDFHQQRLREIGLLK